MDQYSTSSCLDKMIKTSLRLCCLLTIALLIVESRVIEKRSTDNSIKVYLTERICWWNEICKEEFRSQFRCKCPEWSYCRAPGKYYNAYCMMTSTGYIWQQPGWRVETSQIQT